MKKAILITIAVLVLTAVTVIYGFKVNEQKYNTFEKTGYIITTDDENYTTKYYFNENTKYKKNYSNKITFDDVNQEKINVNEENFIHYSDNSIGTLKKSVILNINEINSAIIPYYNMQTNTVLEYENGKYKINNISQEISINDYIVKISDNKYMVVSKNMQLVLDKEAKEKISGYYEITYIDENVIKIENQEISYQTISSEAYIMINNVKIDLNQKSIFYGEERKLEFSQMVIDSDDNIELTELPEQQEEEQETEINPDYGKIDETTPNGGSETSVTGGQTAGQTEAPTEQEYEEIPVFNVTELETTTNILDANIQITDNSGLLSADTEVKILENSTGKIVYMTTIPNGVYNIPVSVDNLNPNTNYTLIAQSKYKKDGVEYLNDFVSKIFRTESLGIDVKKDYFTTNELSLDIITSEYSNAQNFTLTVTDQNDNQVRTQEIEIADFTDKKFNVIINELQPDKEYTVTLSNFMYEGLIMGGNYNLKYTYKTLKERPTISDTLYTINKKESSFTLALGNLSDPNNGIISYRYEIYDATEVKNNNNAEPVATIKKEKLTSIDIKTDEQTIYRGRPSTFKVICEFFDNEKIIEYETAYSNIFQLEGVQYPSVSFNETSVTFERITGQIVIDDPGRTMQLDSSNIMTVVYKNSIGISESFEYYGNLVIPFDKNNLRASETYTISVYGTIDLQDGNGPIYCLIGSTIVNTPSAKPIKVNSRNTMNVNNAFTIEAQLTDDGIDNTLEANTLTSLTFNLYAGNDTNAPLIKSVKKMDRNIEPYSSNLKQDYYDQEFTITPEFFGLENSDINSKSYTIEITNGYDYTKYENPIQLTNNIIKTQSNGVVPSKPNNPDNAIEVNTIRNMNKSNPREDLYAQTIVGYKIRANYDNSSNFLKYIKYYIYDATTNQLLTPDGIVSEPNSDGTLNYVHIDINDGVTQANEDGELRRGNQYYFTYEAYLDMDSNNEVDAVYPQIIDEQLQLKSTPVAPLKQEPQILLYPSTSSNTQIELKYNIQDVDNTIVNDKIMAYIGSTKKSEVVIEKNNQTYETMTFGNLAKGTLTLSYDRTLQKGTSQRVNLIEQKFEGVYTLPNLTYHINQDDNKITLTLNDYDQNISSINRIAAVKVKFISANHTKTFDYMPLDNDRITIDLTDINEMINEQISIEMSAYYNSEITGFDVEGMKTIEYIDLQEKNYLALKDTYLFDNDTAAYSIYDTTFDLSTLKIKSKINNQERNLPVTVTSSGIQYNYNNINVKKIESKLIECDSTPQFTFNKIVPGISLANDQGQINIKSTLTTAKLKIKVYGSNASYISDNKIAIELYKVSSTGTENEYIKTMQVQTSQLSNDYTIDGLDPKTNYYIKLYANLTTNNGVEYTELYDVDFKVSGKLYYFSTLSKVGITMESANMEFNSYQNKNIKLKYKLNNIIGINTIEYKIYKYEQIGDELVLNEEPIDFGIQNDTIPTSTMEKLIACPPGSNCEYGTKYKIEIIPYALVDNELIKLDDNFSYDYTTPTPSNPFIAIRSSYVDEKIKFKISVIDPYKMIVEGKYRVNIFDVTTGERVDITPANIANREYSILDLNTSILIDDDTQTEGKTYELLVTTYIDRENKIEPTEVFSKKHRVNSSNFDGIYLGDVYTTKNKENPQKIDILFYNSNKLYEIDEIRYSIYNSNGYARDNRIDFNPVTGNPYLLTLPEILETEDIYYIEIQFLKNNTIMKELSIEYAYM